jgi:hypothetical protein
MRRKNITARLQSSVNKEKAGDYVNNGDNDKNKKQSNDLHISVLLFSPGARCFAKRGE